MSEPLNLTVTVDNSPPGGAIGAAAGFRPRTLNVLFDWQPPAFGRAEGSFRVTAFGSAIDDGGGARMGWTTYGRHHAYAAISQLRSTWQRLVIEYRVGGRYPFSAGWDLSGPVDRGHLDAVGLDLARAGRRLFTYLFRTGDEDLREIANLLEAALRRGEQLIEIHSDQLFAPWWMLYTPPEPQTDLLDQDAPWDLEGFWGFRHLIQHTVRRHPRWFPEITAPAGQLAVGLNVDRRIDTDPRTGDVPYVAPLTQFFSAHTSTVVRGRKKELAQAVQAADFPDQLIYFACHGRVAGGDGTAAEQASLILSDDDPILTTDFVEWFDNQPLSTNPVVFIGACQGGQMSSMFYDAFGLELLKAGANCVIGPQVDLPVPFAARYAHELFTKFLAGNCRLGDVVRDLTRRCALERRTPLGLIISLYRGLDTQLVSRGA
jgi:CHAT domain-containing protein